MAEHFSTPPRVFKMVDATALLHKMSIFDKIPLPKECDPRENFIDGANMRLRLLNGVF